ncbi:MAG: hypothetical protein K5678_06225 [Acetatifactor sp.]|nr:hypothetical protein [Acetatifactor sp.]
MKKTKWLRRAVLFLWMIGCLMLTGCPNPPPEKEIKEIEKRGIASFEEAMLRYGFEKDDYEVTYVYVNAFTNSSMPVTDIKFKIGDVEYVAIVDDETSEVFINYYADEFQAALEKYFCEKVDQSGALSGGTYELTVKWLPRKVSIHVRSDGMVPAKLMPEDFEAFFEEYHEGILPELEVFVYVKYYSPKNNLTMNKMSGLFDINAKDNISFDLWNCEVYQCEQEEADETKLIAKYEYSYITQKVKVEFVTSYEK